MRSRGAFRERVPARLPRGVFPWSRRSAIACGQLATLCELAFQATQGLNIDTDTEVALGIALHNDFSVDADFSDDGTSRSRRLY